MKSRHCPATLCHTLVALSALLTFGHTALADESTEPDDLYADTWVATDGAGRTMPTSAEAPLKTDKPRTVGIFYITWHTQGLHNGQPYKADVSRVLDEDPGATRNADSPAWTIGSYHWGEPEYGYFLSRDEYVIRHDMSMLADAGVDVIILDVTNAVLYWDEWEVLFRTMQQMKSEGNRVPQFCFWAFNGNVIDVVQSLYDHFYRTPRYEDLWFYWQGKPLLLYNATPTVDANPGGGQHDKGDYSAEVREFFTLRNMWWGYYEWAGKRYVGTEDNWSFGLQLNDTAVLALTPEQRAARHEGRLEEYAVTPAQHPISIVGKSWSAHGGQPDLDERDMPVPTLVPATGQVKANPTAYGIYFQERWDEALQVDPDFVYLNDWNEWTAGKYRNGKDPSGQADMTVNFLGRSDNPFYFVDQYNAEFNRTIAPMKGGYTDNYYMQMAQNIRRYKGVRPIPVHHGFRSMAIDGRFADWESEPIAYRDTHGDTAHRDHDGYGDLHYTDSTGRNDIVLAKTAIDRRHLYFYAETAEPLTPADGPGWMLLLIDADCSAATGWNGYDCLVTTDTATGQRIAVRWDAAHSCWDHAHALALKASTAGCCTELAIPRRWLGLNSRSALSLDFKWADNPTAIDGDIITLVTTGDTAPNRRFNYRFLWQRR